MKNAHPRCPICSSSNLRRFTVKYHFVCGYIGPEYDFNIIDDICLCPKCKMALKSENYDWEKEGYSYICDDCGGEFIVSMRPGPQV